MILTIMITAIVLWVLAMAAKFYRRMDWEEPADPSPDLHGMHKRQAELQHIQDVLESAAAEGKLSKSLIDEYNRFCDQEIEAFQAVERAWKERRKK